MTEVANTLDAVHTALRWRIQSGQWDVSYRLAPATQLAKEFQCSVGVVSKAIALLAYEGLVEQRQKSGTRVIRKPSATPEGAVGLDAFAFIYPSAQHEGIWRTMQGFQKAAHDCRRKVMMLTTGTDFQREAESIARLSEFDVKGAVIFSNIQTPEDQLHISQALLRSKFPFVLACIDMPNLHFPAVIHDDFHGSHTMTRYLIERGSKKIGFFASGKSGGGYQGYKWALEQAALAEPQNAATIAYATHPDFQDPLREPTEMAKQFLSQSPGLDGVVCSCDFMAAGMVRAALGMGLRVPEDLRITGIDDFGIASSLEVPLTTYRVPYEKIGEQSFSILNEIVGGKPWPVRENRVRGEVVVRRSA